MSRGFLINAAQTAFLYSAEPRTKKANAFGALVSKEARMHQHQQPEAGSHPNIFLCFCLAAPCHGASSDALELSRLMLGVTRPFLSDHMDNAKG